MESLKKMLYFVGLFALILALAGCAADDPPAVVVDDEEEDVDENDLDEVVDDEEEVVFDEEVTLRLGHHHATGAIPDVLANKLSELAAEKSGGAMTIDVYPGAQLGQELEAADGIMMGTLDMSIVSSPVFDRYVEPMGLDMVPFVFENPTETLYLFQETEIGEILEERMLEQGARILGWIVLGGRDMIFVDKNITSVDEMQGLHMRSPEIDLFINMFEALGCVSTSVTWGEAYTALQAGLVDGMESPPSATRDMSFYEVTDYSLRTQHMVGTMNLVINENVYESIPDSLKPVLLEAAAEAIDYTNEYALQEDARAVDFLEDQGMVFNEVTPEDRDKLMELMEPVQIRWAEDRNAVDIMDRALEILAEYRN